MWKFKFSQINGGKIKLRIYCYIFQNSLARNQLSTTPILHLWNSNFPLDKAFVKMSTSYFSIRMYYNNIIAFTHSTVNGDPRYLYAWIDHEKQDSQRAWCELKYWENLLMLCKLPLQLKICLGSSHFNKVYKGLGVKFHVYFMCHVWANYELISWLDDMNNK